MHKHPVFVVDDHTLLSQAIAQMVNTFENFNVVTTCKNGNDLMQKITSKEIPNPEVILMDVNMPIMNGIEATEWLSKHHPEIKVLALSVEDDDSSILRMIKAGAVGYLLKDSEKSVLEKALNETIKNGYYHTKEVANLLVRSLTKEESSIQLKEKEITFLKLACTELTYKEIADRMCLSPKTIDGYRDNLFTKLDVKNRVGLVIYAIKNKIYTP
ncbi:MAG: DNA-binding response regulator [Flavobacteriaceae bacterium]|nr:DNA-binding response regulator [Flavobacteriaceae bacterium]